LWNLNLAKIATLFPSGLGSIAVESGTCRGNGARGLAKYFTRVITIELSEVLHGIARDRLLEDGYGNIDFVLGNSVTEFDRILPSLPASETIFFFLDAHWSGDQRVDWSSSEWKGYGINTAHLGPREKIPAPEHQCPLAEELIAIVNDCRGRSIILIDVAQNISVRDRPSKAPRFSGEDWSHLSLDLLKSIVKSRLEEMYELENPEQLLFVLGALK